MSSTCCAASAASSARRLTRSGWSCAGGQDAGAAGGDPEQVGDARACRSSGTRRTPPRPGSRRARAARRSCVVVRIGLARLPLRRSSSTLPIALAQRAVAARSPGRTAARAAPSRFWLARSPRVCAIWCRSTSGKREVLEQRDDVGERLVEGEHVGVARLDEAAVHAVEQRVRRLVRDDVVRQAGEDQRRPACSSGRRPPAREVAEQQRLLLRAVVGVRLAQRVRIDAQPLDERRRPDSRRCSSRSRGDQSALRPSARSKWRIVVIATA